jgi:hypothetical protein
LLSYFFGDHAQVWHLPLVTFTAMSGVLPSASIKGCEFMRSPEGGYLQAIIKQKLCHKMKYTNQKSYFFAQRGNQVSDVRDQVSTPIGFDT